MKKILLSALILGFTTTVFAAPRLETKVFIGELSVKNTDRAIVENISGNDLTKELPKLKINTIKNYTPTDLSINLHNISPSEKKKLYDKCNDGQVCKITASVKKEKISVNENESYWLINLQQVEVLKQ